jgi:signal transduction histidine kinase
VTWPEPPAFVAGLFALTLAGALLPLDVGHRHREHIVLTITATAGLGVLGARGLVLVWAAVAAGLLVQVALRRASTEAAGAAVATAVAVTVGFAVAHTVLVVVLGGRFPLALTSSGEVARAALVLVAAWLGTMSVRSVAHGLVERSAGGHGLDPFDSPFVPYLLPVVAGAPVVVAALAVYRPDDPWPALAVLAWALPLHAVCRFDAHRRDLAQRLRREAEARRRLAAIGRVTATVVHQSRHHAGLMGWSIHRLRRLLDEAPPEVAGPAARELDVLAAARLRVQRSLDVELLHGPGPAGGAGDRTSVDAGDGGRLGGRDDDVGTVGTIVVDVVAELAPKAQRLGVEVGVDVPSAAARLPVASPLRVALFNLVDNALDAAAGRVTITARSAGARDGDRGRGGAGDRADDSGSGGSGEVTVEVWDDGPGVAPEAGPRVFEPFFSTKDGGTGMGLAIADAVVDELGGRLDHRRDGGTTSFAVHLPLGVPRTDEFRLAQRSSR